MSHCAETDIERAMLLATFGLEVRESIALSGTDSLLAGNVLYIRNRREGESLGDVMGGALKGRCIRLPELMVVPTTAFPPELFHPVRLLPRVILHEPAGSEEKAASDPRSAPQEGPGGDGVVRASRQEGGEPGSPEANAARAGESFGETGAAGDRDVLLDRRSAR